MRARCCCATAGISWAPLRVAPGPCSAPKASCFSQYDEDIYIYVYTPFFSTSSQRKPPFEACPLFLSSPLSLGCTADEEEVGGGTRSSRCWEAVNERHGVQDLDIRADVGQVLG